MLYLAKEIKERYPLQTIWLYTGYKYEEVKDLNLMEYIDVVVDGKFVEELKNLKLRFKGSENQRIIDVQKSLKENKIILWEGDTNAV